MDQTRKHDCNALDTLVSDQSCPIEFDEDLKEYNIISKDGNARYRMYYCFFCGGALPRSKREKMYTEPNAKELDEIKALVGRARTISEVVKKLGQPDDEADPPADDKDKNNSKQYRYSKRWQSLDLIVRSRSDNSFELAVVGKFKERTEESRRQKKI